MPRTKKAPRPVTEKAPKFALTDEARSFFNAFNSAREPVQQRAETGIEAVCMCCGKRLNENTGVYMPSEKYPSGYHPVCLMCQQKQYAEISAATSRTYALFYACIRFDVPYVPEVVSDVTANHNGVWYDYVKKLQRSEKVPDEWTDGMTDIQEAFGGQIPTLAITGDVMVGNMDELPDERRWEIEWGDGYDESDYRRLDNRYLQLTSEWAGMPIPPRTSMSLHDVARYMLLRDKATQIGSASDAKKYQDMITAIMASEDLKVDRNRVNEDLRVDKIVKWLESRNAIRDGQLVDRDKLVKILSQERGEYRTSLDVVDEMIFCIVNTMRKNDGLPELDKLPLSAQVNDFKGELLAETSDEEKAIMKGLGVVPPEREVQ